MSVIPEWGDSSGVGATADGEEREGAGLELLAIPDYTAVNPYQRKLEEGLAERGVSVTTSEKGRWFPVLEAVHEHGKPDVLHVHFFHQVMVASKFTPPWRGLLSVLMSVRLVGELLALRALGVDVVWTAHDLLNHERDAVRTELAFKHLIVRFLCDDVIIHCPRAGDVLVDTYRLPERTREKMTVIPHGHFIGEYPDDVSQTEARERLDVPADGPVFLFFGWIRRYKNVPLLVKTFSKLRDDDATLLVAGNPRTDGVEREVVEASRGDPRVHTRLEFVPDDEVQLYMNAADAVVLPFRTGRQTLLTSGSALLAMSFGKALVAPQIGCIGDVLDENGGFCYPPSEPDALFEALQDALSADLDAMGRYNYERVSAFDWDSIVDRTLGVYLDGSATHDE